MTHTVIILTHGNSPSLHPLICAQEVALVASPQPLPRLERDTGGPGVCSTPWHSPAQDGRYLPQLRDLPTRSKSLYHLVDSCIRSSRHDDIVPVRKQQRRCFVRVDHEVEHKPVSVTPPLSSPPPPPAVTQEQLEPVEIDAFPTAVVTDLSVRKHPSTRIGPSERRCWTELPTATPLRNHFGSCTTSWQRTARCHMASRAV
jgi:hypothetical protein